MNKRGFLLAEETLKMIIAAICILFLIYFLVSLYFGKVKKQELKEAQESLSRIANITKSIERGEISIGNVSGINPDGWSLFGFIQNKKPNSCAGKPCICICASLWIRGWDGQIKECSDEGVCLISPPGLNQFDEINIKKTTKGLT